MQRHLQQKKLSPRSVVQRVSALRFLFGKRFKRHYMLEHIPFPKVVRRLPIVLSQDEVGRLIDSASNLLRRTMLMTLYSTGVRRAELCHLQVCDIDSQRNLIHIRAGKVGHDRDVPLSPKLLLELGREICRRLLHTFGSQNRSPEPLSVATWSPLCAGAGSVLH